MAAARAGDAVKFYSPLNRLRKSLSSRSQSLAKVVLALQERATGEMAEWLKAHAWKACVRETVPWVRIPLSPPSRLPPIGLANAAHQHECRITKSIGWRARDHGQSALVQHACGLRAP